MKSIVLRFVAALYLLKKRDFWTLRQKALSAKGMCAKVICAAYSMYCARHCADIPLKAIIKGAPCFPHGIFGIFVSQDAVIGVDVVIFQQVTIGSNTLVGSKTSIKNGAPTIEDGCYIGAGAKIIGHVRIGRNSRIGANCCVHTDISPDSVCVSAQARVIQKVSLDNTFHSKDGYFFRNGHWHAEGKIV